MGDLVTCSRDMNHGLVHWMFWKLRWLSFRKPISGFQTKEGHTADHSVGSDKALAGRYMGYMTLSFLELVPFFGGFEGEPKGRPSFWGGSPKKDKPTFPKAT